MSTYHLDWEIGAHTAFSGRICDSLWTSINFGMYATQFFMGNPKAFNRTKISFEDISECKKILTRWPIHVFTHFPYTANFAGSVKRLAWDGDEDQDRRTLFVIKQLQYELSVISNFETVRSGVVIHPGSHPDKKKGMKAIADSLNKIEYIKNSKVILENCAGEGNKIPSTLQELATIISHIDKDKQQYIGVCIDTCHLFAVGEYDLCHVEEIDRFFNDFDKVIGLENLTLIHLNDSETEKGSRVDLHACIGTGYIWGKSFKSLIHLLNKCKSHNIPCILETHGIDMVTIAHIPT